MTVLMIARAEVKDADKFAQYLAAAGEVMQEHGVEVVVRGDFAKTLAGIEADAHIAAVFRYPSMEAAEAIYSSEDYLALVPLRDEACDMQMDMYDE